jgi:hypothetical protein
MVASAAAVSCSGSVKGGNASVTIEEYGGTIFVALGVNPVVTAGFEESKSVVTGEESGATFLASLSDGTRDCSATETPVLAQSGGSTDSFQTVSAGAITVTGGASPVTLLPQSPGTGASAGSPVSYTRADATALAPGSVVTIAAAGDTVPAFTLSLPLPSAITWTQPASPDSPWAIDSSRDLDLAWTGGTTGSVLIGILQNAGPSTIEVDCTFAASASGGSIPASLLAYLLPTTAAPDGSVITTTIDGSVNDSASILAGGRWTIGANSQSSTFSTSATIE